METIATEQVGRYTVETHYDPDPSSPREWDNVGRFAGLTKWTFNDDDFSTWYRSARAEAGGPILALPVKVIDGSYTIVRETSEWSYADGIYWAPLSKVDEEWSGYPGTWSERIDAARTCLRAELDELNDYLSGSVYGYTVTGPDGDVVDSCWGYVGEEDYARSEGRSVAEWHVFADACRWAALPEWVRETVLIHADA